MSANLKTILKVSIRSPLPRRSNNVVKLNFDNLSWYDNEPNPSIRFRVSFLWQFSRHIIYIQLPIVGVGELGSIWDRSKSKAIWRSEYELSNANREIDLNECKHFLKAPNLDRSQVDVIVWVVSKSFHSLWCTKNYFLILLSCTILYIIYTRTDIYLCWLHVKCPVSLSNIYLL